MYFEDRTVNLENNGKKLFSVNGVKGKEYSSAYKILSTKMCLGMSKIVVSCKVAISSCGLMS